MSCGPDQALQYAHSGLLGAGAHAAAAQQAEVACAHLLALLGTSKGRTSPTSGTCARSTMLAIGAAAAIAGLAAVQTEAGRLVMGDLAGSQLVAHASGTLAAAWDNLQPTLRSIAHEVSVRVVQLCTVGVKTQIGVENRAMTASCACYCSNLFCRSIQ